MAIAPERITDSSLRQLVGTVLVAESDPALTESLQSVLASLGYLVTVTRSREELREQTPFTWDMILLDLSVHEWNNLALLEDLRPTLDSTSTPCIVFLGAEDPPFAIECLRLGAMDYLTRLMEPEVMVAKMQAHLRLSSVLRRLRKNNQLLHRLAAFDELTRLYNRRTIKTALDDELQRAAQEQTHTALLLIDLDGFEDINETLGHETGDDVLTQFATLLQNFVRTSDTVGRYGGAEFCVILPRTTCSAAMEAAEGLRETMTHQPITSGTHQVTCTVSIGVTGVTGEQQTTADTPFRCAQNALMDAKRDGGNRVTLRHTDTSRDIRSHGTTQER